MLEDLGLRYDGDFFVPLIRLDLLERDQLPLPNTWEEVMALAERALAERFHGFSSFSEFHISPL